MLFILPCIGEHLQASVASRLYPIHDKLTFAGPLAFMIAFNTNTYRWSSFFTYIDANLACYMFS
ncbi:hypothetical protein B0O80DRAFT_504661 [Mortierella sp. GBAus27b]|nr:hypothetical protein B0O80DRAFT_504661 [Mortierella sp. GBAus27b]